MMNSFITSAKIPSQLAPPQYPSSDSDADYDTGSTAGLKNLRHSDLSATIFKSYIELGPTILFSLLGFSQIAMGEWQQLLQSVFLGIIFSYLLAKLTSIIISFKDKNLTIVRNNALSKFEEVGPTIISRHKLDAAYGLGGAHEENDCRFLVVAEKGSVASDRDDSDHDDDADDDWEDAESIELDEVFSAATTLVAATTTDRLSHKVSNDVQL